VVGLGVGIAALAGLVLGRKEGGDTVGSVDTRAVLDADGGVVVEGDKLGTSVKQDPGRGSDPGSYNRSRG